MERRENIVMSSDHYISIMRSEMWE